MRRIAWSSWRTGRAISIANRIASAMRDAERCEPTYSHFSRPCDAVCCSRSMAPLRELRGRP
jgi:hypothetical protein